MVVSADKNLGVNIMFNNFVDNVSISGKITDTCILVRVGASSSKSGASSSKSGV